DHLPPDGLLRGRFRSAIRCGSPWRRQRSGRYDFPFHGITERLPLEKERKNLQELAVLNGQGDRFCLLKELVPDDKRIAGLPLYLLHDRLERCVAYLKAYFLGRNARKSAPREKDGQKENELRQKNGFP